MAVARINGVTVLARFSHKEMYGRFARTKQSGRNNEGTIRGETGYSYNVGGVVTVLDFGLQSLGPH